MPSRHIIALVAVAATALGGGVAYAAAKETGSNKGKPCAGLHHRGMSGPPGGFARPAGPGHRGKIFDAIAKSLGVSTQDLRSDLRSGNSLADVAKAKGKSLDDVKQAAKEAIEKQLGQDVENGDLTKKQADAIRERLPKMLDRLGERPPRFKGRRGHGHGFGPPPPPERD